MAGSGSGVGVNSGIGLVAFRAAGGVVAGSAFSTRFGVDSFFDSPSSFSLDVADFVGSGAGLFFAALFFFDSEDVFPDFPVSDFSEDSDFSGATFVFGSGDSSGSGVGVFFGPDFFFDFEEVLDPAFAFFFFGFAGVSVCFDFLPEPPSLFFGAGD